MDSGEILGILEGFFEILGGFSKDSGEILGILEGFWAIMLRQTLTHRETLILGILEGFWRILWDSCGIFEGFDGF